jgi:hypothetical protein
MAISFQSAGKTATAKREKWNVKYQRKKPPWPATVCATGFPAAPAIAGHGGFTKIIMRIAATDVNKKAGWMRINKIKAADLPPASTLEVARV